MFLSFLAVAPALAIAWLAAILIALTVHEFSHALVAGWLGDDTAERAGRLTLNPLAHIDPVGFIAMLLIGFGWAKPVPYNPMRLSDPRWGSVAVGLAGPGANLVIALIASIGLRLMPDGTTLLGAFLFLLVFIDLALLFFNLIPVHPLDGSKLFFALFADPRWAGLRAFVAQYGPTILLFLIILSFFGYDIFWIITEPTFSTCSAFVGQDCFSIYARLFAGL